MMSRSVLIRFQLWIMIFKHSSGIRNETMCLRAGHRQPPGEQVWPGLSGERLLASSEVTSPWLSVVVGGRREE